MTREFAVFSLSNAVFAVDVADVREVLRAAALAPAPGRDGVEGMLNLRGEVVPVCDVRELIGLPAEPIATTDYLIVLAADGRTGILRSSNEVRLETVADEAVQAAEAATAIRATIRLEHEVASVLDAGVLLEKASGTISRRED